MGIAGARGCSWRARLRDGKDLAGTGEFSNRDVVRLIRSFLWQMPDQMHSLCFKPIQILFPGVFLDRFRFLGALVDTNKIRLPQGEGLELAARECFDPSTVCFKKRQFRLGEDVAIPSDSASPHSGIHPMHLLHRGDCFLIKSGQLATQRAFPKATCRFFSSPVGRNPALQSPCVGQGGSLDMVVKSEITRKVPQLTAGRPMVECIRGRLNPENGMERASCRDTRIVCRGTHGKEESPEHTGPLVPQVCDRDLLVKELFWIPGPRSGFWGDRRWPNASFSDFSPNMGMSLDILCSGFKPLVAELPGKIEQMVRKEPQRRWIWGRDDVRHELAVVRIVGGIDQKLSHGRRSAKGDGILGPPERLDKPYCHGLLASLLTAAGSRGTMHQSTGDGNPCCCTTTSTRP